MADPSTVPLVALEVHGTFSRASLLDLRAATEGVSIASAQLKLMAQRIEFRGGDPTVAVDVVATMTARLQGLERELLAAARALEGRL